MKRAMWCMALVAVVGLVGFAQTWKPGDPIPTGVNPLQVFSSFTIPASFVMWSEGDLDFAGGELANVIDPGYIGTARTNTLYVYGLTNQAISVSGLAEAYYQAYGPCTKILPTTLTGTAYQWVGGSWVGFGVPPLTGTWDITPSKTNTMVLPACYGGYFLGEMFLEVARDGYNDPAGFYQARIVISITGL